MTEFDLSFTQDPGWIARRETHWEKFVDNHSDTFTRREFELMREYFFTGVPPKKNKFHPNSFITLIPSYSEEAMQFYFSKYVKADKVVGHNYLSLQKKYFTELFWWPGTSLEEKVHLFEMVYGDHFQPGRRFPFFIGKETELRPLTLDANDMASDLAVSVVLAMEDESDDKDYFVYLELIDYWLSIIPYVDAWAFSDDFTDVQKEMLTANGYSYFMLSKSIGKIFSALLDPSSEYRQMGNWPVLEGKLEKIRSFMDGLSEPAELVARWHKAKRVYGHE